MRCCVMSYSMAKYLNITGGQDRIERRHRHTAIRSHASLGYRGFALEILVARLPRGRLPITATSCAGLTFLIFWHLIDTYLFRRRSILRSTPSEQTFQYSVPFRARRRRVVHQGTGEL